MRTRQYRAPGGNRLAGRVLLKFVVLLACALAAVAIIYYLLVQVSLSKDCSSNLRRIYRALELYETERGTLPRMAFFPDNPDEDPDSLRTVLETYGVNGTVTVCPSVHESLARLGLTYVWNARLNGRKFPAEKTWLLVEINALSPDVPAPHYGRYNVLYSDGSVEQIGSPLMELPGL